MKISVGTNERGGMRTQEVDAYRYFGGKRYKWFDWTDSKRAATGTVKRLRANGDSARMVPVATGYSIYVRPGK